MKIFKDLKKVFSSTVISLLTGFLISLVVPSILPVEGYGYIKIYMLYFGYIGFLHLGFIDGMNIKYGGKDIGEINFSELKLEHKFFMIFQGLITLVLISLSIYKKDIILFLFSISIIPANGMNFYKLYYQSIGDFNKYTKISYIFNGCYILATILGIMLFNSKSYIVYCLTQIISLGICFIYLEIDFRKKYKNIKRANFSFKILRNFKIGIFLLISNLALILFNSIDLFFIKRYFDINIFSYYSFAVSLLSFIQVLITTVSITFYNYLARGLEVRVIKRTKIILLLLGVLSMSIFFPMRFIILRFLPEYKESINLLAILYMTLPYMIIIKGLYTNLYKAKKYINNYFFTIVFMLLISWLYNYILLRIFNCSEGIAIATFFSYLTWYIYTSFKFKETRINIKEILYIILAQVNFNILVENINDFYGIVIFLIIEIVLFIFIYKGELKEIVLEVGEYYEDCSCWVRLCRVVKCYFISSKE